MVFLQMQIHSQVLRTDVPVQVLLPQPKYETGSGECPDLRRFPVLYLFHGLSEDQTSWMRHSTVERLAESCGIAVVMPYIGRSFCTDMLQGPRYGRFLEEELPFLVRSLLPVSNHPEDTYLAGCDMGGYGAFRLALRHPGRYAAAASLAGPLDLSTLYEIPDEEIHQEIESIFGTWTSCLENGHQLTLLLEQSVKSGISVPRLFQACGTDDFLLPDNRRFAELAGKLNVDLKYRQSAGEHGWEAWDAMLPQMFAWMFPA